MEEYRPSVLLREIAADYYNEGLPECYEINVKISEEAEQVRLIGDTGLMKRALRSFSDSGPGIPKTVVDVLQRRAEGNTSLHIMGLQIVVQIISAHGGGSGFRETGMGLTG